MVLMKLRRRHIWVKWFWFFAFWGALYADQKICLNMIVKNESQVISDCLASVKPLIDYWVIVDTGSTDGTQKIIEEAMAGIPGELHERPWVDFAHNRNEAMALAKNKGDYLLLIDADEQLELSKENVGLGLSKDCYHISVYGDDEGKPFVFQRAGLIKNSLDWAWRGVLHEEIYSPRAKTFETVKEMRIKADSEMGARTQDPKKYHKDAEILELALEKEPNNSRYVHYLASSYENAKEYALAIKNCKQLLPKGRSFIVRLGRRHTGGLHRRLACRQDSQASGCFDLHSSRCAVGYHS